MLSFGFYDLKSGLQCFKHQFDHLKEKTANTYKYAQDSEETETKSFSSSSSLLNFMWI